MAPPPGGKDAMMGQKRLLQREAWSGASHDERRGQVHHMMRGVVRCIT